MSADNTKLELRSLLAGKSTEELEKLLSRDFAEEQEAVDAAYISTILEVIEEREHNEQERNRRTQDAWDEFQAYCIQAEFHKKSEADRDEKPNHDHQRKIEYCQKSRKRTSAWRIGAIAAAMVVLLCGTAFGWNLFHVIAEWTEEVFYFITGQENTVNQKSDVFNDLHNSVKLYTEVPAVPQRAPNGTQELGALSIAEHNDRRVIGAGYIIDVRMFSVQIIINTTMPDLPPNTYQKDAKICEEYIINDITHYIVGNNAHLSVMWVNGTVEGHIQGNLTVEEMRWMIDSIYEE